MVQPNPNPFGGFTQEEINILPAKFMPKENQPQSAAQEEQKAEEGAAQQENPEQTTAQEQGYNGITEEALGEHPTHDLARCEANTEDLYGFGVFSQSQQENVVHYDHYAAKYDGMQEMSGFNDPYWLTKVAIEKLATPGSVMTLPDARIMDFGCGTGLMGIELKKAGYKNIYGLDGSPQMLEIADGKNCYKWTWEVHNTRARAIARKL